MNTPTVGKLVFFRQAPDDYMSQVDGIANNCYMRWVDEIANKYGIVMAVNEDSKIEVLVGDRIWRNIDADDPRSLEFISEAR
jgi:hypothetical protein